MIRRIAVRGAVLAVALCIGTPATMVALSSAPAADAAAKAGGASGGAPRHSLLRSRELWATIDVCNPPKEPDTVGIRGSMPNDGHERDAMYMRFQLEYLDPVSKAWSMPAHGADSGFIALGAARKTGRQGGTSFRLGAPKGQLGYTMRGVVTFQWRRGSRVVHQATRMTSGGHPNVARADPPGYSAAECTIP
jgi:hypothetical protein